MIGPMTKDELNKQPPAKAGDLRFWIGKMPNEGRELVEMKLLQQFDGLEWRFVPCVKEADLG